MLRVCVCVCVEWVRVSGVAMWEEEQAVVQVRESESE